MGTDGTVGHGKTHMKDLTMENEEFVQAGLAEVAEVLAKGHRLPKFGDDDEQARRIEAAHRKHAKAHGKVIAGRKLERLEKEYSEEGGEQYLASNPYSRALYGAELLARIREIGWSEQLWAFTIVFPGHDMVWTMPSADMKDDVPVSRRIARCLKIGGRRVRSRMSGTDYIGMFDVGVYRWGDGYQAWPHFHGIVSGDPKDLDRRLPNARGGVMNARIFDLREAYYPPGWLEYMAKDIRVVQRLHETEKGYRFQPERMWSGHLLYFAEGYRGLTKLDLTVAGGNGSKVMQLVRQELSGD